jgi:hypothetical protein
LERSPDCPAVRLIQECLRSSLQECPRSSLRPRLPSRQADSGMSPFLAFLACPRSSPFLAAGMSPFLAVPRCPFLAAPRTSPFLVKECPRSSSSPSTNGSGLIGCRSRLPPAIGRAGSGSGPDRLREPPTTGDPIGCRSRRSVRSGRSGPVGEGAFPRGSDGASPSRRAFPRGSDGASPSRRDRTAFPGTCLS